MPDEPSFENIHHLEHHKKTKFGFQSIINLILLLAIVVLGLYAFKPSLFGAIKLSSDQTAGGSGYSAVFLTNSQVYFGKLTDANTQYPKLTEVYYLRVDKSLEATATQSGQPDISLIKLGGELHGPTDQIQINRDQILFIEKLKTDSKVVDSIKQHKK